MFRRVVMVLLAIVAMGASVLWVPAPAPTAAADRVLTAEPAAELGNEVVDVSWAGYRPTIDGLYSVTIMQCAGERPSSLADCYQVFRPPATNDDNGSAVPDGLTGPDGTGHSFIEVRPALQLPSLNCGEAPRLLARGLRERRLGLPGGRTPGDGRGRLDPLRTESCRLPAGHSVRRHRRRRGLRLARAVRVERPNLHGRRRAPRRLHRVELGRRPRELPRRSRRRRHRLWPSGERRVCRFRSGTGVRAIDLTGVVVAFNVYDSATGQRITDMNLTPRLVAIMIGGGQFGGPGETLFSDPEFVAINPGHTWPSTSKAPLLRAERNDDTSLVTRWLDGDGAARQFLDGADPVATVDPAWQGVDYPTDVFEARNESTIGTYNPRSGTITNARRLFNLQAPGDGQNAVPSFEGLFGILDAVTARKFGLPAAKLRPASSSTDVATDPSGFVAADALGLTAGFDAMQTDDATGTRAASIAAPGAYPLTKIDYAMVPTKGESVASAGHIASFVEYASEAGQADDVLSEGYLPLPDQLRDQAADVAAAVRTGGSDDPGPTDPGFLPPDLPFDPGSLDGGGVFDPGLSSGALPAADTSDLGTPPAEGTQDDEPGGDDETAAPLPISSFAGGDGQAVLPLLFGVGLVALILGPGLLWWSGRRRATPS